jgi:hypothetical protein
LHEDAHGSFDRAIQQLLIAANQGDLSAVNDMKCAMVKGIATKDQYAKAIRLYRGCLEEVKSDQTVKAAAHGDEYNYLIEDTERSQESIYQWFDACTAKRTSLQMA